MSEQDTHPDTPAPATADAPSNSTVEAPAHAMTDAPSNPTAHEPDAADELLTSADESLQKLEDQLDGALSDLGQRNRQLEEYLDFLAQERKRDLLGTDADQLTLDDALTAVPQEGADAPAPSDHTPAD